MTDQRIELSPEQFEVQKAVLGVDAATFRRTKLGQYIFDRAVVEEEGLIEKLIQASLQSSDLSITRMAMDIQMRRMLPKYIEEAIESGRLAERNIDAMEGAEDF